MQNTHRAADTAAGKDTRIITTTFARNARKGMQNTYRAAVTAARAGTRIIMTGTAGNSRREAAHLAGVQPGQEQPAAVQREVTHPVAREAR
jgi:thiamine monophosphate kinase